MPEKMNDELLERINGASDQEIQELKAVILADPELSGDFFTLSKEGNDDGLFQYSDRYLVYNTILFISLLQRLHFFHADRS